MCRKIACWMVLGVLLSVTGCAQQKGTTENAPGGAFSAFTIENTMSLQQQEPDFEVMEVLDIYPREAGIGVIAEVIKGKENGEFTYEYQYISTDESFQNAEIQALDIDDNDEYYVCSCIYHSELWYVKGEISEQAGNGLVDATQVGVNALYLCNTEGVIAEITDIVEEAVPENTRLGLVTNGEQLYLYGMDGGIAEISAGGEMLWSETIENSLIRLIPTEGGEMMLLTSGNSGKLELAAFDGSLSQDISYEVLNGIAASSATASCYSGQQFLIYSDNILYQVDPEQHTVLEVLDGYQFDIESDMNPYIAMLSDGSIVLCVIDEMEEDGMYYSTYRFYRIEPENSETSDTITITVGSLSPGLDLKAAITDYNQSADGTIVKLKDYSTYGDEALRQLKLDLASGEGPDLIDFAWYSLGINMEQGYFLNLTAFISECMAEDSWVAGVMDATSKSTAGYSVVPYYELTTILTTDGNIREPFTLSEFLDFLKDNPAYYKMLSAESLLQLVINGSAANFVDYDAGICDFTQALFLDVLETASKCSGPLNLADPEEMFGGKSSICTVTISNAKNATACCRLGKASVIGYPSDGGGTMVVPSSNLAVYAAGQTEAALDFLRYLLNAETQKKANYAFPVLKAAFDEQVEELDTLYADIPEVASDSKEMIQQATEQIGVLLPDNELLNLIMEELPKVKDGTSSAEDAAEYIQQSISVLLSERG